MIKSESVLYICIITKCLVNSRLNYMSTEEFQGNNILLLAQTALTLAALNLPFSAGDSAHTLTGPPDTNCPIHTSK